MKYSNPELLIQSYVESKNNELSFQERNLVEQAHFENQNLQIIIQKRVDMILLEECEELDRYNYFIYKRTKNRKRLLTWRQFTLLKRELKNDN